MKRLIIDNDVDDIILPIDTFNRMFRYARYGYFPCRETRMKIIEAIRRMPFFEEDMLSRELYKGVNADAHGRLQARGNSRSASWHYTVMEWIKNKIKYSR